jgi:hypothetical protein
MSRSFLHCYNAFGFYDPMYEKSGKTLSKEFIDSTYELVNLFAAQTLDGVNIKPFIGIYAHIYNDGTSIKLSYSEGSHKELLHIVEKYKDYYLKTFGETIEINFTFCPAMLGDFKVIDPFCFK